MLSTSFLEMRRRNAVSILQAVRERPGLSRADVARVCDLAKSTVSSVVDELVQSELLQETGSKASNRGRRPVGLRFNPCSRMTAGISLDHNRIEIVLCNLDGIVQKVHTKKCTRKNNIQNLTATVLSELQRLLFDQNLDRSSIGAVGLAVPGPLSYTQGSTSDNVHYETVRDLLSRELNCQILMDSNTNMAALAESRRGAVRDSEEALVVRLGHEVRSALIIDHKLLKGAGGRAGELGHVRVPGVVRKCKCGALGCINAVAASDAIVSACRAKGAEVEDIDDVIWAALHGDKCCQHALLEAGQAVGFGIASCINILAPPDVIVTGRLVAAGNILINPLREAVNKYVAKDNLRNCKLLFDAAHSHSEAIGASLAALLHIDFVPNLVSDVGPKVTEEA